jgi:anti-sigma factor (TIGR02949 family)
MSRMDRAMDCENATQWIEPYLDGDLPVSEADHLASHLEICPACTRELRLARQVQQGLRAMPQLTCPAAVSSEVQQRIDEPRRLRLWTSGPALPLRGWRPAGALAVAAMLLIAALTVFDSAETDPSAREVALAERQVRWTLAYLGQVGQRTGITVRDGVIRDRVVAPLEKNIRTLMEGQSL